MTRRDPVSGLTDAELAKLAEEAYDQRDDLGAWEEEEEPPEISPDVRAVVSVRFNRGELRPIERAAAAAGQPVSTYIRNAAIAAVAAVDISEARRRVVALQDDLEHLVTALGTETQRKGKRGRPATTNRSVA